MVVTQGITVLTGTSPAWDRARGWKTCAALKLGVVLARHSQKRQLGGPAPVSTSNGSRSAV